MVHIGNLLYRHQIKKCTSRNTENIEVKQIRNKMVKLDMLKWENVNSSNDGLPKVSLPMTVRLMDGSPDKCFVLCQFVYADISGVNLPRRVREGETSQVRLG